MVLAENVGWLASGCQVPGIVPLPRRELFLLDRRADGPGKIHLFVTERALCPSRSVRRGLARPRPGPRAVAACRGRVSLPRAPPGPALLPAGLDRRRARAGRCTAPR